MLSLKKVIEMAVGLLIEIAVWLYEGYLWTLSFADKRVENWLFMSSPWYTVGWGIAYLLMVILGPGIMKFLPALDIRFLLVIFNVFMTLLNAYICLELFYVSWLLGYSYQCQPVNYSWDPLEMRIAAALWWFYFSKFLEFADTLFFIVRKKFSQMTFLHVYHHVTMFGFWWIGVKWVAGGSAFLGAMMNSFVHTIMYFYYGYSSAFPKHPVWWKKYLTVLQLVQFVFAIVQTAIGLYINCPFPRWMGYTLIAYMTSFIILFRNFWLHAYRKRPLRTKSLHFDLQKHKNKLTEHEVGTKDQLLLKTLTNSFENDVKLRNGYVEDEQNKKLRRELRARVATKHKERLKEAQNAGF